MKKTYNINLLKLVNLSTGNKFCFFLCIETLVYNLSVIGTVVSLDTLTILFYMETYSLLPFLEVPLDKF